ncbi:hypothetical protein RDWZM_010208 [Blomia tropicalis]|uniref:Uncharacterized protein n=1 Tax=Blomia tropicalis TaxID=40697 RepID=A0A9Q0RHH3_BLOTA|nr:hypothetical protein RDWZM_010208 [Blomia tropicalis]
MLMTNVTPLEMTNRHERHRQRRRARVITKQHENKHEIRRCSMDTFARCLHMMQEVTSNSSLAFPTNMDELDVTCKKLKAGDYCAERYIRSCAGDQQRSMYQDIVQGTKNVIRLICQHGDTQRQYLEYASCFKDIFMAEVKCETVLKRFQIVSKLMADGNSGNVQMNADQTLASSVTPSIVDEEKLKQFCCAYRDLVDCQLKNVRKFCGNQGLQFFERYMSEITNSVMNEHCVGYTYSDKCQPYQDDNTGINRQHQSIGLADDRFDHNVATNKPNRIENEDKRFMIKQYVNISSKNNNHTHFNEPKDVWNRYTNQTIGAPKSKSISYNKSKIKNDQVHTDIIDNGSKMKNGSQILIDIHGGLWWIIIINIVWTISTCSKTVRHC